MIKTRTGRHPYEIIDEDIRNNGGVPLICELTGLPMTRENWDRVQEEAKKNFDSYVKECREKFLFEHSTQVYNC